MKNEKWNQKKTRKEVQNIRIKESHMITIETDHKDIK
jgi:hypothetical protein